MADKQLQRGDQVRLISGGPWMTVTVAELATPADQTVGTLTRCVFTTTNGVWMLDVHPDCLHVKGEALTRP